MEIKSLAHTSFETLAEAFGAAFAAYEMQISPDELRTMLRRRGFDPVLSFAAFDDGRNGGGEIAGELLDSKVIRSGQERIAGFTLNGIGTFGGVPTAYDTGTGTLPEYRGRGLATQIFEASLPHLRAAGIEQYLLEVLQHNTAAVSVYRKLGFEVSREFNYFRGICGERKTPSALPLSLGQSCTPNTLPPSELYEALNLPHFDHKVCSVGVAAVRVVAPEFWDFIPSWQNSFEAIERAPEDFIILGAFDLGDGPHDSHDLSGHNPVGYIIFEPAAGDITQIAVAKTHRRQGIGSALLGEMLRFNRAPGVKCINTEVGRDEALANFLQARGIALAGKQFEMIKRL